jgi:hypothetical protein
MEENLIMVRRIYEKCLIFDYVKGLFYSFLFVYNSLALFVVITSLHTTSHNFTSPNYCMIVYRSTVSELFLVIDSAIDLISSSLRTEEK